MEELFVVSLTSSEVVVLFGVCMQISPVPILGGSLTLSPSPPSCIEPTDAFVLVAFFFFFRCGETRLTVMSGGGLCRMKRVRSSPGKTARGGVSKAAAPSGGGGRSVGAGGRGDAAADIISSHDGGVVVEREQQ